MENGERVLNRKCKTEKPKKEQSKSTLVPISVLHLSFFGFDFLSPFSFHLSSSFPITMPQRLLRCNKVSYQLFEFFDFRKMAFAFTVEDYLFV